MMIYREMADDAVYNADLSCDYNNRKWGIVRCKDCDKYDPETDRCTNDVVHGSKAVKGE